jgi:transcriptional regulator with XRE-family HTH domain
VATAPEVRTCDRCGAHLARDNTNTRCSNCRSIRDVLLSPPAVPRTFWDTTAMRDALATHHMGRVIYVYRTHPWHPRRLSQELVGNWLGLTQAQLSRIESHRAPEEMTKLIAWARILGIPGDLLWFRLPTDTGWKARTDQAIPPLSVPVILGGQTVLLPVDVAAARAQGLNALIGQLAETDAAVQQLDGLPFSLPVPPQRNLLLQALGPDDIAELEHLAAALDDARRYLDGSIVTFLRQRLKSGKSDDGSHGPAKALPLTLGILGAISQHVREVKPNVRRQLLSLGADGAEFAGWLYRDLKDAGAAAYWYDRAMEWAQEAHDTAMQGYVLLRKSQMAYEERDAHRVATLAQAAQHGPWDLPVMVRVEVIQQEARGLAMLGESVATVERKLDEAQQLFGSAGTETGQHLGPFDQDALKLRNASCYIEAGQPAHAAELFQEVLEADGLSKRDEGYYRARRSFACALSGAPDIAAQEGLHALDIAATTRSQRTTRELARTVKALTPWSAHPGPSQLREALRTAR